MLSSAGGRPSCRDPDAAPLRGNGKCDYMAIFTARSGAPFAALVQGWPMARLDLPGGYPSAQQRVLIEADPDGSPVGGDAAFAEL